MTGRIVQLLARRRVALGFATAAAALILSTPSVASVVVGGAVALLGEAFRVWAAGHLEKGREVTSSGPYRFTRHPLYAGSSVMGIGLALGSRSFVVAALVGAYLGATLTAAIRHEEAFLRQSFGETYGAYAAGQGSATVRAFSLARVMRNREYRALLGLCVVIALLALKAVW